MGSPSSAICPNAAANRRCCNSIRTLGINHQPGLELLFRVKPAEVGVVGDQDTLIRNCVVRDIPILQAGQVEIGNVVRFIAVIVRDTRQPCREAFVDQEFHDFAGGSVVRTVRFGEFAERAD